MTFFQRLRASMAKLMAGRHGADEFSLALLIFGLAISMIGTLLRVPWLSLISFAAYVYAMFRIFSRHHEKRYAENQRYLTVWTKWVSAVRQFIVRTKNIRKYKYFKCPECNARLRLPRKVGEVTVTCGKCRHAFKKKA